MIRDIFILIMFFAYGICIGSFLNVVIYRLPLNLPVHKGRSFCPKCKTTLKAVDLVPVFSFIFLKGKCRYCKDPISWRYPFFELLTGVMFVLCYLVYGLSFYTLLGCALMCVLICMAMIDFDTFMVYDFWHFIIIAIAVLMHLTYPATEPTLTILDRIIGAVSVGGILLVLLLITHGVGGGDVCLMAAMGLILGWKNNIFAFFLAYILATIVMLYPIITKKAKSKTPVPMIPFFAISCAIAFLFGNRIIDFYFSLF